MVSTMSETYVECLVKHKNSIPGLALKWILIAVTAVTGLFGILGSTLLFVVALAAGIAAFIVGLHSNLEYEYLYLDKEIIVDKIMNKTRRKRAEVLEVTRMEILAPIHSHQLDSYRNRKLKTTDYSVGEEQKPDARYVMYYNGDRRILLSPSPEFLKAVRMAAPRKVFMD